MATGNITLPDDLLPQLQELARTENRSPDDLAAEAVKQHLTRRALERFKQEAARLRGTMPDENVQEYVDKVVHEYRAENRGR